jgi:hypothetical protein
MACDVLAPTVQQFTRKNTSNERTALGGFFTFLALGAILINAAMLIHLQYTNPYYTVDSKTDYSTV